MQLSILIAVVMGLALAAYDFFANAPIAGATGAVRLIGSIIRGLRILPAAPSSNGES